MFMDVVVAPTDEIELVDEQAGLFRDPPNGLIAAISWESGDDETTTVMVWATPSDRGDFAFEKMMPLIEQGGISSKPGIVQPHRVFVRSSETDIRLM